MVRAEKCTSCGVPLLGKGTSAFKCPQCGEAVVGRCNTCREQAVNYTCAKCGFTGP